ncbi:MAG: tautomerase family protein [Leptothrix sp. (in: b-proteobacteria)]
MAQVKIFGLRASLDKNRGQLSEAVHQAVIEALNYPPEKKFQRFISLAQEDFVFPSDRSVQYTIIEVSMFEGRSVEAKKALVRSLFRNIEQACGIAPQDVEVTIFETPKENWGIRGKCGDELALNYKVNV